MTITVYTFRDANDSEWAFHTQDYQAAKAYAQANGLLVIANEYEWADSEPVDDYRPKVRRRVARLIR